MEWVLIIVVLICIACPILILLYLEWLPWFVSVAFAVWIVSCIASIAFSRNTNRKWYEVMMPSFLLTFVFTIIFVFIVSFLFI